jgi:hypothetical protein
MVTDFDCWHPREAHVNITWRWPTDEKRRPRQVVAQCALLGAERPINDAHTALQNTGHPA